MLLVQANSFCYLQTQVSCHENITVPHQVDKLDFAAREMVVTLAYSCMHTASLQSVRTCRSSGYFLNLN